MTMIVGVPLGRSLENATYSRVSLSLYKIPPPMCCMHTITTHIYMMSKVALILMSRSIERASPRYFIMYLEFPLRIDGQ